MSDHFNSAANLPYPSATEIGREFVRHYYTKWSFHIDDVYQFYGNESVLSYDGHEASGQKDIQKTVISLGYQTCKARIHSVSGLYGVNDSLTLQVCGELSFNGGVPRKFIQSFVLCKQSTKKYYVQTDIFQWVDKVFCAEFSTKKPAVAPAAAPPAENVHYATPAVEKPVAEPITKLNDHHAYVESSQQPQNVAKDNNSSVDATGKPVSQQHTQQHHSNGHDDADATVKPAPHTNGYVKPEPTRYSTSNVSGGGNANVEANANVHHQQQAQPKPQDTHPKSWAKAVSNNASSGTVRPSQPPPSQQQPPIGKSDDAHIADINANHEEEGAGGARRGHPRHYEKRNSGEYRSGHYNNGGGQGNYRYQNRDGGPRDGYQGRDGGPRDGYQGRDGAPPFRNNAGGRDGSNRNAYGGGERRYGGGGPGGCRDGGNRNFAPHHQQQQSGGGTQAGGNSGGGRYVPPGSGNRYSGGQRSGGSHRNYHGQPQQHNAGGLPPQNVKVQE